VVAGAGDGMIGLQQRFAREALDVFVAGRVEEPVPLAAHRDHVSCAQLGEVLGHGGRTDADMLGEVVHRVLAVQQSPHDPQPGRVGEQLENSHRGVDLTIRRHRRMLNACVVRYLRSHADSLGGER